MFETSGFALIEEKNVHQMSHARWAFLSLEGTTRRQPFSEQARNQHGVHLWPQVEHFPLFFLWTINIKISNKL